jgi:hypothetical protein
MIFKILVIVSLIFILFLVLGLWLLYSQITYSLYTPINSEEDLISFLTHETGQFVEHNSTLKQFGFYNKNKEFIPLVTDHGDWYSYHSELSPLALSVLDHYFEDINVISHD